MQPRKSNEPQQQEWDEEEAHAAMVCMHDTEQHVCQTCDVTRGFSIEQERECIKGLLQPLTSASMPARRLAEIERSGLALHAIGISPRRSGYVLANTTGGAQEVKGVTRGDVIRALGWEA